MFLFAVTNEQASKQTNTHMHAHTHTHRRPYQELTKPCRRTTSHTRTHAHTQMPYYLFQNISLVRTYIRNAGMYLFKENRFPVLDLSVYCPSVQGWPPSGGTRNIIIENSSQHWHTYFQKLLSGPPSFSCAGGPSTVL